MTTALVFIVICLIFILSGNFSAPNAGLRVLGGDAFESSKSYLLQKLQIPESRSSTEKEAGGYVLVNEYADQMVGASYCVLGIQCWSGKVSDKIKVVEPFLFAESGLGYTFDTWGEVYRGHRKLISNNNLTLSDIFDLDHWQRQLDSNNRGHSYSPIEQWDRFVRRAPSNLVVVGSNCAKSKPSDLCNNFYEATVAFANKFNFKIVRSVQIQKRVYSFEQFKEHIYGSWDPSEVVVFFQKWRGIVPDDFNNRYAITGIKHCQKNNYGNFLFENSASIIRDSSKYATKYLPENGESYLSVMVRIERIGLGYFRSMKSEKSKLYFFKKCLKGIDREIQRMQRTYNTKGIYLALDCCKYGSLVFRNNTAPTFIKNVLDTMIIELFDVLQKHGSQFDYKEWEASFDSIMSFQSPGYVAQVQRNVASNGKCLLMAGGGSFQVSAQKQYLVKHEENICSSFVEECS